MQRIVKQDRSKTGGRIYLHPPRAVIGLEAEFSLIINGVRQRPEKIFGTAQKLIRRKMLPRTGRSFQLPSGGAIYFDTGVIEVATPIVELEPGCCYRDAAFVGTDPLRGRRIAALGAAKKMPGAAPGFQHALQFFLRNETRVGGARREATRLFARAYSAGPGDVAGGESQKHRGRGSPARKEN
jgi:hypothetical protein